MFSVLVLGNPPHFLLFSYPRWIWISLLIHPSLLPCLFYFVSTRIESLKKSISSPKSLYSMIVYHWVMLKRSSNMPEPALQGCNSAMFAFTKQTLQPHSHCINSCPSSSTSLYLIVSNCLSEHLFQFCHWPSVLRNCLQYIMETRNLLDCPYLPLLPF